LRASAKGASSLIPAGTTPNAYQKALDRLLRDLRGEKA
jgi:hypothetical protein